ncbi:glycosyltransferase family 2 protein [Roseibaca sp. Y0-43]|uniref:glycosyltransferase family 2 protein n=1 Tax=Roseibaca sp. Y0-43 TaxID=2816854 RepID=UPI001D0C6060|nr:glycosyltransferase family A protein [Roseibaca sp. Y0-43]MCC1482860.1 glycosyltransferase family 2 protein [Roseibaca sp. Y0-43]
MTAPSDAPRLAIIIPVYGHPILVTEALESALAQEAPFGIHIVVINDGCPQPETHTVLTAYAHAYPDRLTYLRQPNGGLSAARNAGIAYVLSHLPQVEALFMLDADNRLRPRAMAQAMAALQAHPQAGWVYPSIDMFGIMARCDYGGPYSRLIHSQMNICEAGSLIRRDVFKAGVMFDETFTLGFEDWHFFLSAGDAGFHGINLENFGFFYRKRPESMLSNADKSREFLLGQIRQSHRDLYHPAYQLALEHHEAPRYALWLQDTAQVRLVTDPAHPGEQLSPEAYIRLYWASKTSPMQVSVPPYLLVTTEAVLKTLGEMGLLHGLIWQLECAAPELDDVAFATVTAPARETDLQMMEMPRNMASRLRDKAIIWLIGTNALARTVDGQDGSKESRDAFSEPAVCSLRMHMPPALPHLEPDSMLEALRSAPWQSAGQEKWRWRQSSIGWRGREHQIVRAAVNPRTQACPVLPRLPAKAGSSQIGVLLPGDDQVPPTCMPLLRALQPKRALGAQLHLVALSDNINITRLGHELGAESLFDTISLLGAAGFEGQNPGKLHFDALPLPGAPPALDAKALALLYGMNEIHVLALPESIPSAARLTGTLRRWGVQVTLHVPDTDSDAPGVALISAYEHAFHRIYTSNSELRMALLLQGIPRSKLTNAMLSEGLSGAMR